MLLIYLKIEILNIYNILIILIITTAILAQATKLSLITNFIAFFIFRLIE